MLLNLPFHDGREWGFPECRAAVTDSDHGRATRFPSYSSRGWFASTSTPDINYNYEIDRENEIGKGALAFLDAFEAASVSDQRRGASSKCILYISAGGKPPLIDALGSWAGAMEDGEYTLGLVGQRATNAVVPA